MANRINPEVDDLEEEEVDELDDGEETTDDADESDEMVTIDGKEYPLSAVKNGLRLHDNFTKKREQQLEEDRDLQARQRKFEMQSAGLAPVLELANLLSDPERVAKVQAAVPEVGNIAATMQTASQIANEIENLGFRFEAWAAKDAEFTDEEKADIAAAAAKSIQQAIAQGRTVRAGSIDFKSLGRELHGDALIQRKAEKLAGTQKQKQQRQRDAGTIRPSAPSLPKNVDISKLSPLQKMALGRRMNEAKNKRNPK